MNSRVLTWGSGWGDNRLLLNGKQIGDFDETMMRERATARFDGQEWAFAKAFGGDILATRVCEGSSEPDQPSMAAEKHGALIPRWEVETAAGVYFLRGTGRSLEVSLDKQVLGRSESAGRLTDRRQLWLVDTVPLRHHVFLLWVVTVDLRRKSARVGRLPRLAITGSPI